VVVVGTVVVGTVVGVDVAVGGAVGALALGVLVVPVFVRFVTGTDDGVGGVDSEFVTSRTVELGIAIIVANELFFWA
jgi:ABC-type cobalamin transport system permease subunit